MKVSIKQLLRFPGTSVQLTRFLLRQKHFMAGTLYHDIAEARQSNDGSLQEKDFRKMIQYYGYFVPAILGEAFCLLHGRKMTKKQRTASTYQGAMTGLSDDFFDDHDKQDAKLKELIDKPFEMQGANSNECLFLTFYRKALENVADKSPLQAAILRIYYAQLESKKQFKPDLDKDEIWQITKQKGGESLLFYRSVFPFPLNKDEEELLFATGAMMQLGNDIFDVHKDYNSAISTLLTRSDHISEVREKYQSILSDVINLLQYAEFPSENKQRFFRIISFAFCSRTSVCLDFLEKSEASTGGSFNPAKCSREQLICDMENPGNFLKSIGYYVQKISH